MADPRPLQVERLHVRGYRALRDFKLSGLRPFTALVGPNGSGKSTVLDVFAFLQRALTSGLTEAWDDRGRGVSLFTRGTSGPVEIELSIRERPTARPRPDGAVWTYRLRIGEEHGRPVVLREEILQTGKGLGVFDNPALLYERGKGSVLTEGGGRYTRESPALQKENALAVAAFGQIESYPGPALVRRALADWRTLAFGTTNDLPLERSRGDGADRLVSTVQRLQELHPEAFERVVRALASGVPRVDEVHVESGSRGPELLFKDGPFKDPIEARFASEGTRKLLAVLALLHDPDAPPVVGLEEPENFLHPQLLSSLADQVRIASKRRQFVVATHAPYFVDALGIGEVHVLYRDADGYAHARRADEMRGLRAQVEAGGQLGQLWMERFFTAGNAESLDPLSPTR